jgi:diaminopimelate epimerase
VKIPFVKMSGAGNDMILVDHRDGKVAGREEELARAVCDRRFGVGADGLILLESDAGADFRVRFFNPDGGEYALCGNGARCIPAFAASIGIPGPRYAFRSDSGTHVGEMLDGATGRVELPPVREIRLDVACELDGKAVSVDWGDIGVPHAALWVESVDAVPIERWGPQLRASAAFGPGGANVSFVEKLAPGHLRMRTFERGVEGETWACGSGAAVVATLAAARGDREGPIRIGVRGGHLVVTVPSRPGGPIVLEGPVTWCCRGTFDLGPAVR